MKIKTLQDVLKEALDNTVAKDVQRPVDAVVSKQDEAKGFCEACGRELAEAGCWNSMCKENEYYIRNDIR